ncbi:MAG TPA: hypothetical protein VGH99_04135 [Pseudonocardia sp.]
MTRPARWVVDHILGGADEAVIEWTMYWTPRGAAVVDGAEAVVATRGAEWFTFRVGLISEIRSYYHRREHTTELDSSPYRERGYSVP